MTPKPFMLMILDGWGWSEQKENNAVELGKTPNWHQLFKKYPHTLIETSGEAVGLPAGTMGNSEVGHLNIGAGRVVYQDFTRINKAIKDGPFFENKTLNDCFNSLKKSGKALHLMGLCSDIGVHAHINHLFALLELAKKCGVKNVYVHAITDGRDSPPDSGKGYLEIVQKKVDEVGNAKIATVSGRFYAMDRDKRWDRIEKAYNAIACSQGNFATSAKAVMEASYAAGVTDEFVVPTVITQNNEPVGKLSDGDSFVFFNFRADRTREITRARAFADFKDFNRAKFAKLSEFVCMTEYDETFGLPLAFEPFKLDNIFGEVLSKHGLKQLRIAETEKYAHVTFFFNGGEEKVFEGEDRALIPSPREVATYDLKPEMSAYGVTEEVLKRIDSDKYDVIVLNFANGDMVGHSGNLIAAEKAVAAVDECIGKIVPKILSKGGEVIITADHGNCEEMADKNGNPMTAHSLNPVPLIYVSDNDIGKKLREGGGLSDIAPTILKVLGVDKPKEMTGRSLV